MPLLIVFLLLLFATPASAAPNCNTKVCVKVYTDPKSGKLIITAKRNGSSATPKPIPTRTWKPRPYTPRPKPTLTSSPKPRVIVTKKYTPKPVVKLSLSDQLAQLIPMKDIYYQPASGALVQVPVNFWTTTPPTFKTSVVMLGVPITVYLSPTYFWDFGDGQTLSTSNRGGPYPNQSITHIYKSSGFFTSHLRISWSGNWLASGVKSAVSGGAIIQDIYTQVRVTPAPSKYLN
ncbi:PKD domain containing protein [actinobacterium SCGC AAA044-D11]